MSRQILVAGLATAISLLGISSGCKLVNKGSQAKVDDSDARKTKTQKKLEKSGHPGTKLFNVTRLVSLEGGKSIIIPIAISLEIKNRNIADKVIHTLDFMQLSYVLTPKDTKLTAIIKDLRHAHSGDSAQKLTIHFDGQKYSGRNKYGDYRIEFEKPSSKDMSSNLSKYPKIGKLRFISKQTGGVYRAPLVNRPTTEGWLAPFTEGRFYYKSDWTEAIYITEDMFHVMQGKHKSPTLPANSEFKRNCLDKGLLAKQKEGKVIYYQQGSNLSRDDQTSFRIYGLNEVLDSGVLRVDSLDCYKHDKHGLSHVLYDNVFPHPGLPPDTFDDSGEKVRSIYISNKVKDQDTFHSILVSDQLFSLEVGKSRIPTPSD